MRNYKVVINGITKEYPEGTVYGDIVKELCQEEKHAVVLVMANGRLRELHKTVKNDQTLSFVTVCDEIGHKTYKRSVSFLFLKAMYHVLGAQNIKKITLHCAIGAGYYYTVDGDVSLTEDVLKEVKTYMNKLVKEELPIMKRSIPTDEAIHLFHKHRMYDKEKVFRFRRVSRVNIYSIGDFEDYYYGFMTWHTGYLKYFELYLYDKGIVLQLPEKKNPEIVPPFRPSLKVFQIQMESEEWASKLDIENVGDLNELITHGDTRTAILIAEALQEGKISRIAEEIKKREGVKFVMIAGPSSSGKTTFSQRLAIQLQVHGMKPHCIAVDNYFVNRDRTPLDKDGKKDYECLEAIDLNCFNEDMLKLLAGERVNIPTYNFVTGEREYKNNYLQMGPDDILVIEGIHALNDAMSYALPKESKFKIYISALTQLNVDEHNRIPTTDGRLIRRIVRDARTRGTSATATLKM